VNIAYTGGSLVDIAYKVAVGGPWVDGGHSIGSSIQSTLTVYCAQGRESGR